MENKIIKINTDAFRVNLSEYLTRNLGSTIYITRYNKLIAELRIFNENMKVKTELKIAEKMIENAERQLSQ